MQDIDIMDQSERLESGLATQEDFERVLEEAATIRVRKVLSYGESRYEDSNLNHAMILTYGDVHRKYIRIRQLVQTNSFQGADGESLRDAFMDIANYGLMGVQLYDKFQDPDISLLGNGEAEPEPVYGVSPVVDAMIDFGKTVRALGQRVNGPLPSEALYGFVGWLTTLDTTIGPFGASYDSSKAAEFIKAYCEAQGWVLPREGWEKQLKTGPAIVVKPEPIFPNKSAWQHWHDRCMASEDELEKVKEELKKEKAKSSLLADQLQISGIKAVEQQNKLAEVLANQRPHRMAEELEGEGPRLDQIAIWSNVPGATRRDLNWLVHGVWDTEMDWVHDTVTAEGITRRNPVRNEADLSFNYKLMKHGVEFEVLHYNTDRQSNWLGKDGVIDGKGVGISHIGMHVTQEEYDAIMQRAKEMAIQVAQDVKTLKHTNPQIKDSRRYHYTILDTRAVLGFYIKLIVRLPFPENGEEAKAVAKKVHCAPLDVQTWPARKVDEKLAEISPQIDQMALLTGLPKFEIERAVVQIIRNNPIPPSGRG